MRVYGYLRPSLPGGAELVERQRHDVARYADFTGLKLVDVLVEAPRPASLPLARREEGRRLLRALSPGDAVITPGLDSMFPTAGDALGTLALLKADRVGLHMIELGGDVCRDPICRIVTGLLAGLVRGERGVEAEESRAFKRHLATQKPHRGGPVPFGFDAVKGRLVPRPGEYEVLRAMIALRREGLGYRRIAHELEMEESRVRAVLRRTDRLFGGTHVRSGRLRHSEGGARELISSPSLNQAGRAWQYPERREI